MQRVPLHEQPADVTALVAADFGAAVAVDRAAPGAFVYNAFNVQRHLISRRTLRAFRAEAMAQWRSATAA